MDQNLPQNTNLTNSELLENEQELKSTIEEFLPHKRYPFMIKLSSISLIYFLAMGIAMLILSNQVTEIIIDYTDCVSPC